MKDPAIRQILKRTQLAQYDKDPHSKIVEEMILPVAGARIDIAVINGAFHGYEIKSASDTLKRLPDQLKSYGLVFDYLTIVTEQKYSQKIIDIIPEWVGVSVCSDMSNENEFQEIKPSLPNKERNGFYIAKLLWKEELMSILIGHDIPFRKSDRAWTMCETLANNLDTDSLSHSVRETLKTRFARITS